MLHGVRLCDNMSSVCLSLHLSVCDVQVPWSLRLEYFQNNFTAKYLKASARADPNMGNLVQWECPHKLGWNSLGVGLWVQKPAISLKWCKIGPRLLWRTNRASIFRVHRMVIFAIAQLSCPTCGTLTKVALIGCLILWCFCSFRVSMLRYLMKTRICESTYLWCRRLHTLVMVWVTSLHCYVRLHRQCLPNESCTPRSCRQPSWRCVKLH